MSNMNIEFWRVWDCIGLCGCFLVIKTNELHVQKDEPEEGGVFKVSFVCPVRFSEKCRSHLSQIGIR